MLFHRHWRYPNITLLILSVALTIYLLHNGWLENIFQPFGEFGYIGVFIVGMLFVSTFTVAPAAAVLFTFAETLNPLPVAIIGALGAVIGDYIAFRFIKDRLLDELNPFLKMLHIYRPVNVLQTKYFAWLAPVVGAIVIASPLPDELGLTLLGITKMSTSRFVALSFLLNFVGILLIALAAH